MEAAVSRLAAEARGCKRGFKGILAEADTKTRQYHVAIAERFNALWQDIFD
ncbi:hypothetical protein LC612_04990 [Nostoc sp. CHAB 5834]|nr:hypothetical protein [Nostoc sp. CHAB 5834]